jgi:hypothetical protein
MWRPVNTLYYELARCGDRFTLYITWNTADKSIDKCTATIRTLIPVARITETRSSEATV